MSERIGSVQRIAKRIAAIRRCKNSVLEPEAVLKMMRAAFPEQFRPDHMLTQVFEAEEDRALWN